MSGKKAGKCPVQSNIHPGLVQFGAPTKCTYKLGTKEKCPHPMNPRDDATGLHPKTNPKIFPSVLHKIGNSPLINCSRLAKKYGIECDLLAKCEFFNAGGSVKDRIGRRMIEDAERSGRIKPGDTIIEPTSGNTGIGLALASAVKGYRCIIVMPEKMSQEKVDVLRALGAEIVRTPTSAAFDSPESHIGVALKLNKDIPNSHILDQYQNPSNPLSHYEGTAEEIIESCDGDVDMVVSAAGTGGTIAGLGRKFKEKCPKAEIVGVDPWGSILAQPASLNKTDVTSYEIEGIGYDFIPTVLDRAVVDSWVKIGDQASYSVARDLLKIEGLLCGGSSGSAMAGAIQAAKKLKKGQRCVVILPDSIRNYMTKHLSDDWMEDHGFIAPQDVADKDWWYDLPASALPQKFPMTLSPGLSCGDAIDIMNQEGFDQMPVVDSSGAILGMVTEAHVLGQILKKKITKKDTVENVIYTQFKQVSSEEKIGKISRILDKDHFVLVTSQQKCYTSTKQVQIKTTVFSIVTRIDILNFITKGTEDSRSVSPDTKRQRVN